MRRADESGISGKSVTGAGQTGTIRIVMTHPKYVSAKEVAFRLGCDQRTVRRYATSGRIQAKPLPGGHWRIAVDDDGWPLEAVEDTPND